MKSYFVLLTLLIAFTGPASGQSGECPDIAFDPATMQVANKCKSCQNHILNGLAINFQKPVQPPEMSNWRGAVTVIITVDEKGKVRRAKGVARAVPSELQRLVIKTLRRTQFKVVLADCKPVQYAGTFTVNFSDQ